MSESVASFFAAWAIEDDANREDRIAATLADGIYYADPRTPDALTTVEAVQVYVGQFSKNAPGMAVAAMHQSTTLDHVRATVQFGTGDQAQMGQYIADLNAKGKITRLVGFAGMGTPA